MGDGLLLDLNGSLATGYRATFNLGIERPVEDNNNNGDMGGVVGPPVAFEPEPMMSTMLGDDGFSDAPASVGTASMSLVEESAPASEVISESSQEDEIDGNVDSGNSNDEQVRAPAKKSSANHVFAAVDFLFLLSFFASQF